MHYVSGGAGFTYGAHGIANWNNGWYSGGVPNPPDCCYNKPPRWQDVINLPSTRDMKYLVEFFDSMQWWKMSPDDSVVNSGRYALVETGKQYVIWLGDKNSVKVDLSSVGGTFDVSWFNPVSGIWTAAGTIDGGAQRTLNAPSGGDDVLYLKNSNSGDIEPPLNGDGDVDILDYSLLVSNFGTTGSPGWIPADIDSDGDVDLFDYNLLVSNFGSGI